MKRALVHTPNNVLKTEISRTQFGTCTILNHRTIYTDISQRPLKPETFSIFSESPRGISRHGKNEHVQQLLISEDERSTYTWEYLLFNCSVNLIENIIDVEHSYFLFHF